jgi:cell division protein ZapA
MVFIVVIAPVEPGSRRIGLCDVKEWGMAHELEIDIFGQAFRVAVDQTCPDYIQRLAAYVNERMQGIAQMNKAMPYNRVAVLAALNIADDLLKLRDHHEHATHMVQDKTERLLALLQPYTSHP